MFGKYKLLCKIQSEGEFRCSYNWGSVLHGVFMDLLPKDEANNLHSEGLRPFSQYITPAGDNSFYWTISLLGGEQDEQIAEMIKNLNEIDIKSKNISAKVTSCEAEEIREMDFIKKHFAESDAQRQITFYFVTPCTHKSDGRYMLFPTVEHIYKNLYTRYNMFAKEFSLEEPEALSALIENTRISGYNLKSSVFHTDGIKILGYTGRLNLYISGPEPLARLGVTLLSYANFSGIGIKTSLGMGGCEIRIGR